MRLFVAIDLDNAEYFKEMQYQIPDTKSTYPKEFHLTLKFLGETDETTEIIQCLKKIKFKKFILKTTNIGTFPSENYINVVWLGLDKNKELKELQQNIEDALESFRFKKDFDFHPHITLARIKFIRPDEKEGFLKAIKGIKVKEKEFEVKDFKLIKSELTSSGPVYTDIERFFCS